MNKIIIDSAIVFIITLNAIFTSLYVITHYKGTMPVPLRILLVIVCLIAAIFHLTLLPQLEKQTYIASSFTFAVLNLLHAGMFSGLLRLTKQNIKEND